MNPVFDSFHSFASKAAAEAVLPEPQEKGAAWVSTNWTIMPIQIWLWDQPNDTIDSEGRTIRGHKKANGYWMLACTEKASAAATMRAQPSFRLQMIRPEVDTPWRDCITHTQSINPAVLTVLGYNLYAGSKYVFD